MKKWVVTIAVFSSFASATVYEYQCRGEMRSNYSDSTGNKKVIKEIDMVRAFDTENPGGAVALGRLQSPYLNAYAALTNNGSDNLTLMITANSFGKPRIHGTGMAHGKVGDRQISLTQFADYFDSEITCLLIR